MDDWKQKHADDSEEGVLNHPLVVRQMESFARNMGFELEGLPRMGLLQIVSVSAQVARAHALGFDPELLRLAPHEADEQNLAIARKLVEQGKPVLRIDSDGTTTRLD